MPNRFIDPNKDRKRAVKPDPKFPPVDRNAIQAESRRLATVTEVRCIQCGMHLSTQEAEESGLCGLCLEIDEGAF